MPYRGVVDGHAVDVLCVLAAGVLLHVAQRVPEIDAAARHVVEAAHVLHDVDVVRADHHRARVKGRVAEEHLLDTNVRELEVDLAEEGAAHVAAAPADDERPHLGRDEAEEHEADRQGHIVAQEPLKVVARELVDVQLAEHRDHLGNGQLYVRGAARGKKGVDLFLHRGDLLGVDAVLYHTERAEALEVRHQGRVADEFRHRVIQRLEGGLDRRGCSRDTSLGSNNVRVSRLRVLAGGFVRTFLCISECLSRFPAPLHGGVAV
jgi:hypothetical protein